MSIQKERESWAGMTRSLNRARRRQEISDGVKNDHEFCLIIAGSRNYDDYPSLRKEALLFLHDSGATENDTEIVSGGAKGADALAKRFADEIVLPFREFPADWDKHGRMAGPIRNQQMADYATHLIAFPMGESRGTRNMIAKAKEAGLEVKVVEEEDE